MFLAAPETDAPNYERAFASRPEVYAAWLGLNGAIKAGMDRRRYELVSIAAARALTSSYCALAHANAALSLGLASAGELADVASLPADEQAIVAFAEKVVRDATSVGQGDVDALRAHGLSDQDVFDVVAATTARCFFAKTLDAVGAQADSALAALEPASLRDQLTVGRPIAAA
jgi:uncharacterized peroxidase-related enzyme